MADEQIVTNIVATSDFSSLIADVQRTTASLSKLQQQLSLSNKTLAAQAGQIQKAFGETLRSTGQFTTHFVTVGSEIDTFGKKLDGGKLKLGDYFRTWQQHTKTSGGLIRDLAKQQVALQNAVVQPLGKSADGLMKFNVHVANGLNETVSKTALARKELQIYNKVIQDGGVQLINWGKNTQWAGRQLTVGLTVPLAAFGMAAAKAFREADQELVRLTKVYGGLSAVSAQELAKVRKDVSATARELSAAYGSSFKDTIALAADIAATGKQGNELLESTKEATRLSILGEVDRQEAMKATLAIQSAFKQNTTELTESINFLNAVENQTSTSLADLVEAIPKAGPVVKALGGDVEDLALYLTAMREGGINASEGANALKSALASIINPTKVAKEQFMGFGIDLEGIVNKNAGNLTQTILSIQSALDTLDPLKKSQAIEQLFGKFQFARMNALFENLGKQGSQTLQVLDLMKASSQDLANVAGRELSQITESASGQYKRAIESLKADLAGLGDQFLRIGTFFIKVVDGVVKFINKMPDPIKNLLGLLGGITALAGPLIMLTGVFANFIGYVIKGIGHIRALGRGGEGFKLLTPQILAAEKAGSLIEKTFYNDAEAAGVLKIALSNLTNELTILQQKAASGSISVQPTLSTIQGNIVAQGTQRVADPNNPLIGKAYSRQMSHLNPVAGMTTAERAAQTIFGVVPGPGPVNQKIGKNPQIYAEGDLPKIEGVTSIKGVSTGIVAQEAAKWHSMTAALAMQSKEEIALLKREVGATGAVTTELSTSYKALLPQMTNITSLAAQEAKLIVAQLQSGKVTVDQARAKIISLNAQVEAMMAETAAAVATSQGRVLNISAVPLTGQPVVDPNTGKTNMKEMFHKSKTSMLVDKIARSLGVRTSGGGYSTHTTIPKRLNTGGYVYGMNDGDIVPGPNVNKDIVPAILTPGEFVVNREATQANLPLLRAINSGSSMGMSNDGYMPANISNSILQSFGYKHSRSKKEANLVGRWGMILPQSINDSLAGKLNGKGALGSDLINALQDPDRLVDLDDFLTHNGVDPKDRAAILKNVAKNMVSKITPDAYYKDPGLGSLAFQSIDPQIKALESKYPGISLAYQKDRMTPGRRDTRKTPRPGETQAEANKRGGPSPTGINIAGQRPSNYGAGSRLAEKFGPKQVYSHFTDVEYEKNTSMLAKSMGFLRRVPNPAAVVSSLMPRGRYVPRARFNKGGMVGGMSPMGYNDGGEVSGYSRLRSSIRGTGTLGSSGEANPNSVMGTSMAGMGLMMGGQMVPGMAGQGMTFAGMAMQMSPMLSMMKPLISGMGTFTGMFAKLKVGAGATLTALRIGLAALLGPIGLISAAIGGVIALFLKMKKDATDAGEVNRATYGLTATALEEVGIKYKTVSERIKEVNQQLELNRAKVKSSYETYTKSGVAGLDITLKALREGIASAKKEDKESVGLFDKARTSQVNQLAASMKAQYVALGMSVQEATNQIYILIKASNKSSQALDAISSESFKSISDKASGALYSVELLGKALSNKGLFNAEEFSRGLDNMLNSLTSYKNSLMETTKKQVGLTDLEANREVIEKITKLGADKNKIDEKTLDSLKAQNLELAAMLGRSESLASIYAKYQLYLSGASAEMNLSAMGAEDAVLALQGYNATKDAAEQVLGNTEIAKSARTATAAAETANKILDNAKKQDSSYIDAAIKNRQKLIKALEEERSARLKILDLQERSANFETEIQQAQLRYQEALAAGDMAQAAQEQLNIQKLSADRQRDLARQSINDKADAERKKLEMEIEKLQAQKDAQAKALSIAQSSVAKKNEDAAAATAFLEEIKAAIANFGGDNVDDVNQFQALLNDKRSQGKGSQVQDLIDKFSGGYQSGSNMFEVMLKNLKSQTNKELEKSKYDKFDLAVQTFQEAVDKFAGIESISEKNPKTAGTEFGPTKTKTVDGKNVGEAGRNAVAGKTKSRSVDIPGKGIWTIFKYKGKEYAISADETTIYEYENGVGLKGNKLKHDFVPQMAMGGAVKNYNPGGSVSGPGTGTSDSIPAYLSNGEYVIKAAAVEQYGVDTFDAFNAQKLAIGGSVEGGGKKQNAYQKFMFGAAENSDWMDKLFGIDKIFRLLGGDRSSGNTLNAAMAALGGPSKGISKLADNIPELFHGSSVALKPGNVIKPGGFTSKEYAFATTREETANSFAMDAARKNSMTSLFHPDDKNPMQQALWGLVYKLKANPDMFQYQSGEKAIASKSGFEISELSHMIDSWGKKTPVGPPKFADGGMVKDGWLQKYAKSLTGNPLSEMMGTAALLRKIAGVGQKGDNLSAAMMPLSFTGMGIGSKIGTSGGLMKALYSLPNKINQIKNQAKVNAMIKNGMWHGSQPQGFRGEEYLQGTNILDGAETHDPFYGMGFFGTSSKSEADMYASGYNSTTNWGESFGSMNQITKAPKGKYVDFTRGTNSLKWQNYELAKALGVKKNEYLGKYMTEKLGDVMNSQGMTGAIMNRINAGRAPKEIQDAKWLGWNNPTGVHTIERAMGGYVNSSFNPNMSTPAYAMGGIVGPKYNIPSDSMSVANKPFNRYNEGGLVNNYGGITVNPAPGMDEKMLAKYVMQEIKAADAINFASQGRPGSRYV
jgi:TP901 family phage tail tape measure protein